MVSDIHCAEVACASVDTLSNYQAGDLFFATLSASGTLHTPRLNSHGKGTILRMKEGYQIVICAIPQERQTANIRWSLGGPGPWALFQSSDLANVVSVVGPDDALCVLSSHPPLPTNNSLDSLIPPGTRYAIITVEQYGKCAGPAVTFWLRYYSRHCMMDSLLASIQHTVWWRDWGDANRACHGNLAITLVRLLRWQAMFNPEQGPFCRDNLFALVCMGKMCQMLKMEEEDCKVWDEESVQMAEDIADTIVLKMDHDLLQRFRGFQSYIHKFYLDEWMRRRQQFCPNR
jgi:hypothetical protein